MKNEEINNQEVSVQSGYLALQEFNMAEAIQEEMAGLDLTFEKVKIPAGGGLTFDLPSDDPDSPDSVKEFSGVIVYQHPIKMYYREKYTGANNPPDCGSFDSITGIGNPGGKCLTCEFDEYGSALDGGKGKACRDRRRIYILREGEVFPMLLSLPTGSLKNFRLYLTRLLSKLRKPHMVVTKFSLKKAINEKGAPYSQATFAAGRDLTADELTAIASISAHIKNISENIDYEADDSLDEDEAPIVDHETGEIVQPLNQ